VSEHILKHRSRLRREDPQGQPRRRTRTARRFDKLAGYDETVANGVTVAADKADRSASDIRKYETGDGCDSFPIKVRTTREAQLLRGGDDSRIPQR